MNRKVVLYSAESANVLENAGAQTNQESYAVPNAYGAFSAVPLDITAATKVSECWFEADIFPVGSTAGDSFGPVRLIDRNHVDIGTPYQPDSGQVIAHMPRLAADQVREGEYGIVQLFPQYANCASGQVPPTCHTGWVITHAECPAEETNTACSGCFSAKNDNNIYLPDSQQHVTCQTASNKSDETNAGSLSQNDQDIYIPQLVFVEFFISYPPAAPNRGYIPFLQAFAIGTHPGWTSGLLNAEPTGSSIDGGAVGLRIYYDPINPTDTDFNRIDLVSNNSVDGFQLLAHAPLVGGPLDGQIRIFFTRQPDGTYSIATQQGAGGGVAIPGFDPVIKSIEWRDPLWWGVYPKDEYTGLESSLNPCLAAITIVEPGTPG